MFSRFLSLFLILNMAATSSEGIVLSWDIWGVADVDPTLMKKSITVKSYADFREDTARSMYNAQVGLMSDFEKYRDIVFKFFDNTEEQLIIGPSIVKHYGRSVVRNFVSDLIVYETTLFNLVVFWGYNVKDVNAMREATNLLNAINKVKNAFNLDLDVHEEFAKLSDLVFEGNSYYYKQLDLGTQAKIGAVRFACSGKIGIWK